MDLVVAIQIFVISSFMGLACSYLTKIFLLEQKDSHTGPFSSTKIQIYFVEDAHLQPAGIFDRVRRIFGAYEVTRETNYQLWKVINRDRTDVWSCPKCLSFYTAIPFTALMLNFTTDLLILIVSHLIIVSISTLINQRLYGG